MSRRAVKECRFVGKPIYLDKYCEPPLTKKSDFAAVRITNYYTLQLTLQNPVENESVAELDAALQGQLSTLKEREGSTNQ